MSDFHEIINFDDLPVRVLIHKVEKYKLHWHRSIEIILVLKGSVRLMLNGEDYTLAEDDLVLINSSAIHSTIHDQGADNMLLALQIPIEYFRNKEIDFSNLQIRCISNSGNRDIPVFKEIRKCIGEIVHELNKASFGYKLAIESRIDAMITLVLRNFATIETQMVESNLNRVQSILDYIDANFSERISLEDIAEREHLSTYYMSHFFREKVGISFKAYLKNIRLKKAHWQISNTNKSVIEIAVDCGFANVKALNKLFKEVYDMSPGEYRKSKEFIRVEEDEEGNFEICYLDVDKLQAFDKLTSYREVSNEYASSPRDRVLIRGVHVLRFNETRPLIPYWRYLITFGRAYDCLRMESQTQLRMLQDEIEFQYIRFHGIFSDEMRVVEKNQAGQLQFTWNYIDSLFDFLLSIGLKPFVEFTFMPSVLKSKNFTVFQYKGNISMPHDFSEWRQLITAFLAHCVNRYGLAEVLTWYFEVWNEPDLMWMDSEEDFYQFFVETVSAVHAVHADFKILGPSTMSGYLEKGGFLGNFLAFIEERQLKNIDISYHLYGDMVTFDSMGRLRTHGVCEKSFFTESIHQTKQLVNSFDRKKEVHLTEFNFSAAKNNDLLDTAFMAPFVIDTALKNIGKLDSLGFWAASDIFEESTISDAPFHGGYGMISKEGIKKPSYWGYWFLSQLGDVVLERGEDYIVTKNGEDIQILLYNYVYVDKFYRRGDSSHMTNANRYDVFEEASAVQHSFRFGERSGRYRCMEVQFDQQHGSPFDAWVKMGVPINLTSIEKQVLHAASLPAIYTSEIEDLKAHTAVVTVEKHGVTLLQLQKLY